MRVYVVRHAAAAAAEDYERDSERPLTRKGARTMKAVAKGLRKLGLRPEMIFTSPLVRAAETAEMLADVLGSPVETREELAPGVAPRDVIAFLASRELGDAAIVGHEPQLGEVISEMVAGSEQPVVDMRKAGVVCVDFDSSVTAGEGVIKWYATPEMFETL